jgi:hypothetical protein
VFEEKKGKREISDEEKNANSSRNREVSGVLEWNR